MFTDHVKVQKIYIASGYTDLRAGIDKLVALIQNNFNLDPFDNSLFMFCGRRTDRIKAILWDGNGFLLLYKRMEAGRFQWPRNTEEVLLLTEQQCRWLMEGLKIDQPGANKPVDTNGLVFN